MKGIKKGLAILLVLCTLLSMVVMTGAGVATGTRPENGTTTSQPFTSGTGGSTNFRIPALVTLSDGTLVAAADARWNQTYDGYGLDTIVSRSSNNGETWNYTFANYLGDNGNVYNSDSTAFIDPALAVARDDTIYMLVDLYPHGTYIGNVKAGTGFDSNGHLLLSSNSGSSYDYYVGDFTDGKANIYSTNGTSVNGYTVDEYYNITGNGYNTNLFFSDSPYQVLGTSYLYLTKSTDGGKTWSAPTMLNPQVKDSGESFYGVGPGRGLVTSTGRIIFACYKNPTEYTSFIYSDDNGKKWTRTANLSDVSSEATLVEADGRLYAFTRTSNIDYSNITYYTSTDDGTTWSAKTDDSSIDPCTSCQMNAITYSKKIDGKTAILLSCPTGSNRTTGKIFVGLVQDGGSINWKYTYSVNSSNAYAYSCLTELDDGSIGLLYEKGNNGGITYTNIPIANIATGATIGDSTEPATAEKDVTLYVGQTKTVTDESGNYESSYTGFGLNNNIATVRVTGTTGTGASTYAIPGNSSGNYTGSQIDLSDCLYTFTRASGNYTISSTTSAGTKVYLNMKSGNATIPNQTRSTNIEVTGSNGSFTLKDQASGGNGGYLYFHYNVSSPYFNRNGDTLNNFTSFLLYRPAADGENSSTEIPGYVQVTSVTGGGQYLIAHQANDGNYYVLHPSTGTSQYEHVAKVDISSASTAATSITIKGISAGTTAVTVGNTKYNITVLDRGEVVTDAATVAVGSTTAVSIPSLDEGETVVWSVNDSTYAGVYSTSDTEAKITGRAVGETDVNAIVYDADGNVVTTYIWDTTVTTGTKPNAGNYTVTWSYTCTIYNGTLYYSLDGGPMKQAVVDTTANDTNSGEVGTTYTVQETDAGVAYASINWFVAPNEGYAVTSVGADANSKSQFYAIDKSNNTITYTSTHSGGRLENFLTEEEETAMIAEGVSLGCDAIFWNSRGSKTSNLTANQTGSNAATGTYIIHCDKLPTVDKQITSITSGNTTTPYTDGMTIKLGDTINYTITVSYYDVTQGGTATNTITYSNLRLTDELTNGNQNLMEATNKTVSKATTETYTTALTVTMANYADVVVDGEIVNTVDLTYDYQSSYSSGSYGGSATAEASIAIEQPEYVIDFGLPVEIDLSTDLGTTTIASGTAHYGTISVKGRSFTYTPTETLKGVDYVTLTLDNNAGSFGVTIYPATTVYYEEGFAVPYPNGTVDVTTDGTSENLIQQTSTVGSKDRYGYDDAYNSVGDSNGTTMELAAGKGAATFTFTGTGVDVYTQSTTATGSMMIRVVDDENKLVKVISVNTVMKNGGTDATDAQEVTAYNVPVVSLSGLEHGTYTLQIAAVKSGSAGAFAVYIDGFRVHGTLDVNSDVYQQDGEANPTFVELRNSVLKAEIGLDAIKSQYAGQIADSILSQVYAADENGIDALVVAKGDYENDGSSLVTDVQDLLDNGPKNEIYLRKDESLVFTVYAGSAQIGLKALDKATSYKINNGAVQNLSASTDMFYPLTLNSDCTTTITITNNGDGILSITELKLFGADTSAASVEPLSAPALTRALMSLGYEAEPVEATATLNITVQAGGETLTTTLTATGTEGERHTFTAAEIQAAVEVLELPEGYTLDGVTFEDVTVTCGEASDASFTAAEIPAPTPVSPLQKIVQIAVKIIKKIVSWF